MYLIRRERIICILTWFGLCTESNSYFFMDVGVRVRAYEIEKSEWMSWFNLSFTLVLIESKHRTIERKIKNFFSIARH